MARTRERTDEHVAEPVLAEMFLECPPDPADADIAGQAAQALRNTPNVAGVRVTAHGGVITLTGDVDWLYQRAAAGGAVSHVGQGRTVVNAITVHTDRLMAELECGVTTALAGYVSPADVRVSVSADGDGAVELRGAVPTSATRRKVLEMAWAVPGVTAVSAADLAVDPGAAARPVTVSCPGSEQPR